MKTHPIRSVCLSVFLVSLSYGEARAAQPPTDPAAMKLNQLRAIRGDSNLSFQEISDLATQIHKEHLPQFAQEIGTGRTDGMRGWVRAAVYAEWGKRDFAAAMKQLSKSAELDSGHQQALYAVFRGSRPTNSTGALLHLRRMFQDHPRAVGAFTRNWAKRALREVFSEMAATQPEKTWQILTNKDRNKPEAEVLLFLTQQFTRKPLSEINANWIAMEGFFAGLPDIAAINIYATRFGRLWNTPEIVSATREFRKQMQKRVSSFNWTPPPPHEHIGREVAISMTRFDLDAAIDWIATNGPDSQIEKNGRIDGMLTEWAWRNPEKALALLKQGRYGMRQKAISIGILRGNARLAPDLVKLPDHGGGISFILGISFAAAATMMEYDMYPVPGRGDVLPSHQIRYEAFREAIRVTGVTGDKLNNLLHSLNGAFQYTVPAAKQAIKLAQRN